MNLKTKLFFLLFILATNSLLCQNFSESNQLKFKKYSQEEGLSQSSVLCILQDSKGYMWFGTRDGLNNYDGHKFKTYRCNHKDKRSISNSFIKCLFEDKNGNIWVGTNNGLNRFDSHEERFERYECFNQENNLSDNEIWSIASGGDNFLWVGTNSGLEKLNIQTKKRRRIAEYFNDPLKNQIRSLFLTSTNNLWICNRRNIIIYNDKRKEFKEIPYPQSQIRKPSKNYMPIIFEDKDKSIWLGYRDGLALFNTKKNEFQHFRIEGAKIDAIHNEVRAIYEDLFGNLWIGTYNGLYIIDKQKMSIKHYAHDEKNKNSLSQNSIFSIVGDSKGDVWVGTYAGGVNYFDRSLYLFKNYDIGIDNNKLNYKVVSSIVEDSNRNLWIGTEGGGINFLDKGTGKFTYYTHNKNNPNSISTNNIKAILQTKDGNFWIGTHDGGLNFFNPKEKDCKFRKYKNNPNDTLSLGNDRVISLFEDIDENIWVGTSGGGLNLFNTEDKVFLRIKDPERLIGEIVFGISETHEKEILLISGSKGLVKINIHTKEMSSVDYKEQNQEENSIITLCAYEDRQRNLWIGTEGNGLFCYNSETGRIINYLTEDGLPSLVIYSILADDYNNLWFSTNKGLSRLDLTTCQFKNFDVSDGLPINEFNYNSRIKLANKELMFGSTNGVVFFNPNEIVENSFIPPVYVTSFSVNNQPYLSGIDMNEEIILNHNQNVFGFDFIALSYSKSDKNKYAYMLEGFDDDWNYIGNKKSATYTNLDAGNYVFKVKASNSDGLWNERGQSINIKILPPFWKTWWAYLLYVILIAFILLLIRRYSLLRANEKNELKQERLEKEKIEEINRLKLELFTNISHDLRTPLTLILGPLQRMLSDKEGSQHIQRQHQIMYRNANILLQLVNQLLDFRKSETGRLKLKVSKNDIVAFIDDIKKSFEEMAYYREIDFSLKSTDSHIDLWFDVINLKKVFFNLLSNSFKFTPNKGSVKIKIATKNNKFIKIKIKDTGKGIPKKDINFIFDRYYQIEREEKYLSGAGIGLALAKNIIALHKGQISVKSKENKGTSFIIKLPSGSSHLNENQLVLESSKGNTVGFSKENIGCVLQEFDHKRDGEIDFKIPTLLLVDDNIEVRNFIKQIFGKKYNIIEAENGESALKIASNTPLDLIISDVMMPIMSGTEFCRNIKTSVITSHIPVLLLTAKTSQESKKEGYENGADIYITKPFDPSILEQSVENILNTRKSLIEKFKKDIILKPKELDITSEDEIFLKKSIKIVEENFNNTEFCVSDFINEMGMSRSALYRKLKALTGQSITEFIKVLKLKRAAQLISETKLTISEIAFTLGFNDLKYFRKSFKKQFSVLPSQYRLNLYLEKTEKNNLNC